MLMISFRFKFLCSVDYKKNYSVDQNSSQYSRVILFLIMLLSIFSVFFFRDTTSPDFDRHETRKESFMEAMHLAMKVKNEANTPTIVSTLSIYNMSMHT